MIAKLPGDKKIFMGDNLELVVLFQAAEIQRLIQNLEEFKLKYKENERSVLDRHSYEVQIKELTHKISDSDGQRSEVEKLKDFIRRQSAELEEIKRTHAGVDVNIQRKYENALRQIDTMMQDNIAIKNENNTLSGELNHLRSKLEATERARLREVQDVRGHMDNQRKSLIEREVREVTTRFQSERGNLEIELRRLRETLDGKNRETEDLKGKLNGLNIRIQELTFKTGNQVDLERRIGESDHRLNSVSQQLENLNRQLQQKTAENNELIGKIRHSDSDTNRISLEIKELSRRLTIITEEKEVLIRENQDFQRRLGNASIQERQVVEYQNKIVMLSQEVERLNHLLVTKTNEAQEITTRFSKVNYELESLVSSRRREGEDTQRGVSQLQGRLQEVEMRLNKSVMDNERLATENRSLLSRVSDFDKVRGSNKEFQMNISRLSNDNRFLAEENQKAQEGLRTSSVTLQKLSSENAQLRRQI